MSFFDRFKTTLRADANGLIDAIEEPSLMLKQHLRDAELAVHAKRAQLSQLEAEAKRLGADRQRAEADRARLAAIKEESRELATKLEAQTHELEELRARVQAFIANAEAGSPNTGYEPVTEEQIEIELLRRKAQPRTTTEAADAKA